MIWCHDHALGNTRTNVHAGLARIYASATTRTRVRSGNPLGLPAGPYEIPLVLQDKTQCRQIGADSGLLRAPVPMTALLIAPGERADVIIDFAGHRNASFIVTNNARAPYPMGGRATLSQLLRIRVNRTLTGADATTPAARLTLPALAALPEPSVTRVQHLSETLDPLTDARSPSTSRTRRTSMSRRT